MLNFQNSLISANPGSGKTRNLSENVAELISSGVSSDEVLCLTFTNKARDHMEESILLKLNGSVKNLPEISTFHGLANRIVSERNGKINNFPERIMRYLILKYLEDKDVINYDPSVLMKDYPSIVNIGQIVNSLRFLKSFGITPEKVNVETLQKFIRDAYATNSGINGYGLEEMIKLGEEFINIFAYYEKSKDRDELDYNDLLIVATNYCDSYSRKYKQIFIDEAQDMSMLEYELVKRLSEHIYAVGDSKQAIFGFQGGDIESFRAMKNDDAFNKSFMEGTWRLPEKIKEYCKNFFISNSGTETSEELKKFSSLKKGEDGEVKIWKCNDFETIIDSIIQIIEGKEMTGETGIIVRTNDQANKVSERLNEKGIAHQKVSGTKGYTEWRMEIANFVCGLFGNTDDIISLLYSRYSGIPLNESVLIVEKIKFAKNVNELLPLEIREIRKKYAKDMEGILKIFKDYIIPRSLTFGQEVMETTIDVYNSLPFFFKRVKTNSNFKLSDLKRYILQENSYDNVESIDQKISVITVHKAKGLEFENVIYVPKTVSKKTLSAIDLITGGITSQFNIKYDRLERVEEECRIDFVALSRASKRLNIFCTNDNFVRFDFEPASESQLVSKKNGNEFISLKKLMEEKKDQEDNELWLIPLIEMKMKNFNKISFSMLQKTERLEDFVLTYILGIKQGSYAMQFGTNIHAMIESHIKENVTPSLPEKDSEMKTWSNFLAYERYVKQNCNQGWLESEMKLKDKVENVFPGLKTDLFIEGRIDAVYKCDPEHGGKTVIVDFKTSKKPSDDYSLQLSLYAKLYSLEKKIDFSEVESEIGYLSLRDTRVNLGNYDKRWDRIEATIQERSLDEVRKMVTKFIRFRNSAEFLASSIIEIKNPENPIVNEVKNILKKELSLPKTGERKNY